MSGRATTWDGVAWSWSEPGEDKPVLDLRFETDTVHTVHSLDDPPGAKYNAARLAAARLELRFADVRGRIEP